MNHGEGTIDRCRSDFSGFEGDRVDLVPGGSSDGVQPVELANAIVEQSPADRFFHKPECPLYLSRFGFSLLSAELGRELLVRLSADIGLSLLERPMGVL
jgi:hypothetical protein